MESKDYEIDKIQDSIEQLFEFISVNDAKVNDAKKSSIQIQRRILMYQLIKKFLSIFFLQILGFVQK